MGEGYEQHQSGRLVSENGIPVLCLFTEDILTAQKIFDALNRTSYLPTEKDIDDAIDFLQSGKLGILKTLTSVLRDL